MYYRYLETNAAAKARYNENHRKFAADRMKKVASDRAARRREKSKS